MLSSYIVFNRLFNAKPNTKTYDYRHIFIKESKKLIIQYFDDFFETVLLNHAQTNYDDILDSTENLIKEIDDNIFDELINSINSDAGLPYDKRD